MPPIIVRLVGIQGMSNAYGFFMVIRGFTALLATPLAGKIWSSYLDECSDGSRGVCLSRRLSVNFFFHFHAVVGKVLPNNRLVPGIWGGHSSLGNPGSSTGMCIHILIYMVDTVNSKCKILSFLTARLDGNPRLSILYSSTVPGFPNDWTGGYLYILCLQGSCMTGWGPISLYILLLQGFCMT